jgi:HSP20 family molecular chaperone IbpA
MRNFEKFRRAKVTSGETPIVAIHQRGLFAMNQLAFEALGEPKAVGLLFDRDNQVIGLEAAERDNPDSYVVRHHTKYSHHVEGRSFLSYYDVPKEATGRRYKAELVDGVLEVDLKQDSEETNEKKGKQPR